MFQYGTFNSLDLDVLTGVLPPVAAFFAQQQKASGDMVEQCKSTEEKKEKTSFFRVDVEG